MTLKQQLTILAWLFFTGFMVVGGYILSKQDGFERIITKAAPRMKSNSANNRFEVPTLEPSKDRVVHTGSMVFVSGKNITQDSVVMINDKLLKEESYMVAVDTGVYLKAEKEGGFKLNVANSNGVSNSHYFSVNNNINLQYMDDPLFMAGFGELHAELGGKRISLNKSGQGIAKIEDILNNAVVIKGVSSKTGVLETLAGADKPRNSKAIGVVANTTSTAIYLINKKLRLLSEPSISGRQGAPYASSVQNVKRAIEESRAPTMDTNDILKNKKISQAVAAAVRDIRRHRS